MNSILPDDDSIVPTSLLGLEAFNKGEQSQVVKLKQSQNQRRESVRTYVKFLEELQEKRKEESKKRGYLIPESAAELYCKQKIATIKEPNQVDVAAFIYSYQNFAHFLFSASATDVISKKNRITLNPKRIIQAVSNMKESTLKRQFLSQSKVPEEQRASRMWATMFSILERISALESAFSALKSLFHEEKQDNQFGCTDECLEAKQQLFRDCHGTPAEQLACKVRHEKARRCCSAETFFDQFYIPVCFVRRNAYYKDTQLGFFNQVPLTKGENVNRAHQLMDVHFLSILQFINLAMSSLEHLATLNPFPSVTVHELIREAEDESVEKTKSVLKTTHLRGDLPLADNYEEWPENCQYRSAIDPNLDVDKIYDEAEKTRDRVNRRETHRIDEEKANHIPTEAENLRRLRNQLQNLSECFSLQDGVHDEFSDERIEVYRSFLPSNSVLDAESNNATIIYSVLETKETRFGESPGGYSDPRTALENFFPDDHAKFGDEFGKFCKDKKISILGSRGKQFMIDRDLTALLFSKFLVATDKLGQWILSVDLETTMREIFEKKVESQIETPNFRAWSSMALQQLDSWLETLQNTIATDAVHWSCKQLGENVTSTPKHETLLEYAAACKELAPWLFERNQSESMILLLERRSMERHKLEDTFREEETIIDFQYDANRKRLWSVDSAIDYCNERILKKETNFSVEDQQLWNHFGKRFENPELRKIIEKNKDKTITKMVWTVCCDPFLLGSVGFAVEPGSDTLCRDKIFAPNQKRDFKYNPSVELHEYIWQLFRNQWSSQENNMAPQVAQLGNGIVDAFMQLKNVEVPQPQGYKYLLSDFKPSEPDSERKKIVFRLFNIINQVESFLPLMQLGIHNKMLKIERTFGHQTLEECHNSMLKLIGSSSLVLQPHAFPPQLYEMSLPFISLASLSYYQRQRLIMNAMRRNRHRVVVPVAEAAEIAAPVDQLDIVEPEVKKRKAPGLVVAEPAPKKNNTPVAKKRKTLKPAQEPRVKTATQPSLEKKKSLYRQMKEAREQGTQGYDGRSTRNRLKK